ncbi:MAG: glycosyltransferase [Caldilineales bacterium]|nr:glycosyltransferase [Caldilineales bacterium]
MIIIGIVIAAALLFMLATVTLNAAIFPRLRATAPQSASTLAFVLIPARNESATIAATVRRLLSQTYRPLEVIVLDDNSDDGTGDIAQAAAGDDPRFQLIRGSALPEGWLGKNWACQQLGQQAQGEILVFIDADVVWQPNALAAVVAEMERTRAGLLAVWPTQHTETWGERLVVPLMAMTVMAYLPLPLVHHTPWRAFAAANGQCLAFRRSTYESIGGHQSVRDSIVEDVSLARRVKGAGHSLRMADGAHLVSCRMYEDWPAVRDGYAKNIIAGYGGIPALILATLFHWTVFLLPWFWLTLGWTSPSPLWPLAPLALVLMGIVVRMISAAATCQRKRDSLLMPVSAVLMTLIAARALWWQWRQGGPSWKGRMLQT